MKSFESYQHVRILTTDGTIASGDYILEGVTIRCDKNGFLNDVVTEEGIKLPALETHDGSHVEHWKNGVLHNNEGPAIVDTSDNYEKWYMDGNEVKPEVPENTGIIKRL